MPYYGATNAATGVRNLASGGIAHLDHLYALKEMGLEGAIIGRALYSGEINLAEAIKAAQ